MENLNQFVFASSHLDKITLSSSKYLNLTENELSFLKLCFASEYNNQPDYTIGYFVPENFACHYKNVALYGDSGGVSVNNKLIVESFHSQKKMFQSNSYRKKYNKIDCELTELTTSIFHQYSMNNNIFHWYIECLPRLYLLKKLEIEKINLIIPYNFQDFQRESIKDFCKDFCRITLIEIGKNEVYHITNYLFLSFINSIRSGFLSEEVLSKYNKLGEKNKRIFISRKNNNLRDIINEKEFLTEIRHFGFESYCLENLEPSEQKEIFSKAEIIIGVHGAGLTNIIFSNKPTVIEIHPKSKINPPYFFLCKAKNIKYHYFIAEEYDSQNNVKIKCDKFSAFLKNILCEK